MEDNLRDIRFNVQDGKSAGLYFERQGDLQTFVEVLKGKAKIDGDIHIDNAKINSDFKNFKRNMDFIPNEHIDSTLSLQQYIYFYSMLRGSFESTYEARLDAILEEIRMNEYKTEIVSSLSLGMQIIIRCVAAYLQNVRMMVFESQYDELTINEHQIMECLLKKYKEKGGICLFLSSAKENLVKVSDFYYEIA